MSHYVVVYYSCYNAPPGYETHPEQEGESDGDLAHRMVGFYVRPMAQLVGARSWQKWGCGSDARGGHSRFGQYGLKKNHIFNVFIY